MDQIGLNGPNKTEVDQSGQNGPNRTNVDRIKPMWTEWTEVNKMDRIVKWKKRTESDQSGSKSKEWTE